MKKIVIFVAFCIAVLAVTSCGEKKVVGDNGKEYTSYQDACRDGDFSAAYKIIEITDGTEEDKDYVFNAEMLYLASQNTEDASSRILYLLAEYHIPGTPTAPNGEYNFDKAYDGAKKYVEGISRYNNRCNSVLDMAIALKNEKLANGVINLMKQNVDVEEDNGTLHLFKVSSKGVNNNDIDIAKKKLEEAIKDGKFNNKEE